jgi:hypothetical protein
MLIAFYKSTRPMPQGLFNIAIRGAMDSKYSHCEAIFGGDLSRPIECGSSSFIDGGVRIKDILLNSNHWDVLDVPRFDAEQSRQWFIDHTGEPYDVRGLAAVILPVVGDNPGQRFCSEAILDSVDFHNAHKVDPGRFYDLCVFVGGVRVSILSDAPFHDVQLNI